MTEPSYLDLLRSLLPELVIGISALTILTTDLFWAKKLPQTNRHRIAFGIAFLGGLIAIGFLLIAFPENESTRQWLNLKNPQSILKIGIILLTLISIGISNASNSFTKHIGEFYLIALFALVGMMIMVSADHLLLAFMSLEWVSLSFYMLVAFHRKNPQTSEAAFKYFLLGGVSAAFTLLGMSFLYGATGEMHFDAIAEQLNENNLSPMLIVAMGAIAIGFGFKIAAVPMHLWAPDTYQMAAPPVAALIASASKLAGFYLFARIWTEALGNLFGIIGGESTQSGWFLILSALTIASILLGNLIAIVQSNVRRLLAYSAVAHAGYGMLGILDGTPEGMAALIYYLFTYGLAVAGVFSMIALAEKNKRTNPIPSFSNFHHHRLEAFCLLIFLLSLAGIPPLAGFFGKFYLFASTLKSPSTGALGFWLVILAILMSVISLYYYLQILKQVYVIKSISNESIESSLALRFIAILLAIGVILLGMFPEILLAKLLPNPN